jgi:hypothetical protein
LHTTKSEALRLHNVLRKPGDLFDDSLPRRVSLDGTQETAQ